MAVVLALGDELERAVRRLARRTGQAPGDILASCVDRRKLRALVDETLAETRAKARRRAACRRVAEQMAQRRRRPKALPVRWIDNG